MPVAAPTPQRAPGPSRSTRRPALSADTADAANLFALQKYGNIYSRIGNPTVAALEERIASLEGGIGAVATASGMAAEFITFAALVGAGDHVVASAALYGGTVTQLDVTLRRFGVATTFVPGTDPADYAAAIRPETRVVFAEVIGNPSGEIADIAGLAEVAHAAGVPLVIDSTLATPYLCRPIEHGADIVIHSVTKFRGGHGTTLGGVVPCPPRNLVTEWMTMSAPCSIGRHRYGVARVESITSGTPAAWATSARPAMSAISPEGFPITSAKTTLVSGRIAAA